MKNFTLLVAVLATSLSLNAQFNFKFDYWSNNATPDFYGVLLNGIIDSSVVKVTGYTGSGARLNPKDLTVLGIPAALSILDYGQDGAGAKISASFDSVSFYMKQSTNGTDLQLIATMTTTLNNGDTVAYGEIAIAGDVTNWTRQAFEMVAYPGMSGVTADSMFMSVISFGQDPGIEGVAYAVVDDFMLINKVGSASLNEVVANNNIHVYPTMTSNEINFELGTVEATNIQVINMNGQVVSTVALNGANFKTIDVKNFDNGMYIYQVNAAHEAVVAKGRFVVAK